MAVEVLDQVGKVVSSSKATTENGLLELKMSINNLPSGFYSVRIMDEGKSFKTAIEND